MDRSELRRSDLTVQFREIIPSRLDLLDPAIERIMESIAAMPGFHGSLEEIKLALTEAVANAIIHGNKRNPDKKVEVYGICEDGQKLVLTITDQGEGFDPATVPDPTTADKLSRGGGRGIFLIRELMDHMEYRKGGRQMVISKRATGG